MKRFILRLTVILLTIAILLGTLATTSCTQSERQPGEKLSIVCTIFPQYDWVRQILGDRADNFDITLLLDDRIDLHNFQPSVEDIVKISTADLFIYVGGESDGWVEDALARAVNEDMLIINLIEALGDGVKMEEIIDGMDDGHDHHHDDGHDNSHDNGHGDDDHHNGHDNGNGDDDHHNGHDDGHDDSHDDGHDDHHHEHEDVPDEHIWLSLKNAQVLTADITDALAKLDADNADEYRSNLAEYISKLSALDAQYQAAASNASTGTLLFGDRFPFRYLVDDYGIDYYAAFPGCSAETEASFETIVFLAQKMDELSLRCVMVTESSDRSIAQTIIQSTSAQESIILELDSMQSVTIDQAHSGTTYLSIMESNLSVLIEALQ